MTCLCPNVCLIAVVHVNTKVVHLHHLTSVSVFLLSLPASLSLFLFSSTRITQQRTVHWSQTPN